MDIRYKYAVSLKNKESGEKVSGFYRSRCSTSSKATHELQRYGHQTVTSIIQVPIKRRK